MKVYKVTMIDVLFNELTVAYYTEKALLEYFPDLQITHLDNEEYSFVHYASGDTETWDENRGAMYACHISPIETIGG